MRIQQLPTPQLGGPANGGSVSMAPALGIGPKGDKGDQGNSITGPQGPPGPGTGAGAWQATTAYTANQVVQAPDGSMIRRISTGTSRATFDATEKALWTAVLATPGTIEADALISSYVATLGSGVELRESFASIADGPAPAKTATNQTVTNYYAVTSASAPYVRGGFLTTATPASAEAGSYRIAHLERNVVRVGARFAFTAYSTGGGLLCLSIQNDDISQTTPVPVAPLHFTISPTGWGVDVNDTAGTAVEAVSSGNTFTTPLTADGTTLHTVEVVLDRDLGKCYVFLPSGQVVTLTDPRFSLPGAYVYIEPFKSTGSLSSKTDALVREWWADSRASDVLPRARATARASGQVGTKGVADLPGSDVSQTITTAPSKIIGSGGLNPLTCTFTFPDSGAGYMDISAYVSITTAGPVHLGVFNDSDALIAVRTVASAVGEGQVSTGLIPISGTPGTAHNYKAVVYRAAAAVASVKYGNTGSAYYGASARFIPA